MGEVGCEKWQRELEFAVHHVEPQCSYPYMFTALTKWVDEDGTETVREDTVIVREPGHLLKMVW